MTSHALVPQSVQVGEIAVVFAPPRATAEAVTHNYDEAESPEQARQRAEREYDEIMYASSEGARLA